MSLPDPRERVDLAVLELFAHLSSPLARNFRLKVNGSPDAESVRLGGTPPPCLFPGSPLVIQGETDVPARVTLALEWDAAGGPHRLEVPLDLQPHADADVVRLLQGARLITDLESRLDAVSSPPPEDRERRQVLQTLTALSKHYGLASRALSLFAVVRRPSDQAGEPPRTVVVPVGMPEDTAFASYFRTRRRAAFTPSTPTAHQTDGGVYRCTLAELPSPRQFPSPPGHPLDTCLGTLREEPRDTPMPSRRFLGAKLPSISTLLELASRIEPDGGMPGPDDEQRWLASILALYCFTAYQFMEGTRALEAHIRRLVQFLKTSPYLHRHRDRERWLERIQKGEMHLRNPAQEVSRLLAGEPLSTEMFRGES